MVSFTPQGKNRRYTFDRLLEPLSQNGSDLSEGGWKSLFVCVFVGGGGGSNAFKGNS
jgi:hypothetical protein